MAEPPLYALETRQGEIFKHRKDFGKILNYFGLFNEGAEIGVQRGEFAETILKTWQGRRLHLIDPWKEFDIATYKDVANVPQNAQDKLYAETVLKMQIYGDRVSIIREASEEAFKRFENNQLDFVYIDAQHHYEAISRDLRYWHSKVRTGGIVAGHDYLEGQMQGGQFGVKTAVNEFVIKRSYELYILDERPDPQNPNHFVDSPTWFFIKK
jgi:hypothetical protein